MTKRISTSLVEFLVTYHGPSEADSNVEAGQTTMATVQARPAAAPQSPTDVLSAVQWAVQGKAVPIHRSDINVVTSVSMVIQGATVVLEPTDLFYGQVRTMSVSDRPLVPAPEVISPLDVGQQATLVVASRVHAHTPVSFVAVRTMVTLAAIPTETEINQRSEVTVNQESTLVAQGKAVPWPLGGQWVASQRQLVAQYRDIPIVPYGPPQVASQHQLVMQKLSQLPYVGELSARSQYQLTAQARDEIIPLSASGAKVVTQLSAVAVDVLPADQMDTLRAGHVASQAIAARPLDPPDEIESPVQYRQLGMVFARGRTMPPPGEVVDPEVGRHVRHTSRLAVQQRDYMDIPGIGRHVPHVSRLAVQRRFTLPPVDPIITFQVELLAQHTLLVDSSFPEPPTEPIDIPIVRALSLGQAVLLEDHSFLSVARIDVGQAAETVLLADRTFGLPDVPYSQAGVSQLAQTPVLVDNTFPDPLEATATVRVGQLTEAVLLADRSFPTGDLAASTGSVMSVVQSTMLVDRSFPPGDQAVSTAGLLLLAETPVIRDNSLVGLPPRPAGPRPVISISIS